MAERRCDHTLIPSLSPEDSPLPPETLGLVQHSPTSSFLNQSELKVSQRSSFFMSKLQVVLHSSLKGSNMVVLLKFYRILLFDLNPIIY